MLRYGELIYAGLRDQGVQVERTSPPVVAGRLGGKPFGWRGHFDKYVIFPCLLYFKARNVDVVHICDHSYAGNVAFLRGKANVVTCHDLLSVRAYLGELPQGTLTRLGNLLQRWNMRGMRLAGEVLCVSENTSVDLGRILGAKTKRSVILNALNYPFSPMPRDEARAAIRALGVDPDIPYLLHVGGDVWYKNRLGVVRIFAKLIEQHPQLSLQMVMAGKPLPGDIRAEIERRAMHERVKELVSIPNESLRALYSGATALLFPSFEEGFGWPIIEAQACGCPVITSNLPPMTDVAGGAAILIDPHQEDEAARIIGAALPAIERLREAGFKNVERFSVNEMSRGYIHAYETVLKAT